VPKVVRFGRGCATAAANYPVQHRQSRCCRTSADTPATLRNTLPMPHSPPSPCTRCGQPVVRSGKCQKHLDQYERRRGSATDRGYGRRHRDTFRPGVLAQNNGMCVWPECTARASVADHYPRTRRELVAAGLDPDDPRHGRPLCAPHHNAWTASTSAGFGKPAT
jgi:5-methylcytosine-specific restriction protein A